MLSDNEYKVDVRDYCSKTSTCFPPDPGSDIRPSHMTGIATAVCVTRRSDGALKGGVRSSAFVNLFLRTLRRAPRLCVKLEPTESILAYDFVGVGIEEIDQHEFFRMPR